MKTFKTLIMILGLVVLFMNGALAADQVTGVVNVNKATPAEIMLVPGIGPAKAQAIVSLRADHNFQKKEDLLAVKGIGQKMLDKIAPYIVLTGESDIHLVKTTTAQR